ncbi:MAG: dihydrolipoyllysine-residue acetyltransferase [Betaproteobacteria bacterium]|nr:dihydrolipoyllysine-residue acetyltransferase [Betaproteobacteria bacterium]
MAQVELRVPDIGDFKEVEVIEVLVKAGDEIGVEQSLITVESDKASMEIPASVAGKLLSLAVKVGDKVGEGSLVGMVEAAGASAGGKTVAGTGDENVAKSFEALAPPVDALSSSSNASPEVQHIKTAPPVDAPSSPSNPSPASLPHASPSVRKFARELGVDLTKVSGSGPKGRITQEDVQKFVKDVMSGALAVGAAPKAASGGGAGLDLLPWPQVDFTKFGPVDAKPLSRIKKISGANLHRNWVMIPHVTGNDEADITDLEALRVQLNKENEKAGIKVTMLAFLMKAAVAALKKFPEFNASLDGDTLVLKQYFHIGFAADTPNGLVVPVIRDVDKKGVLDLAVETSAMAKKARDGKLSPSEMQGGCFSVSSLGGIGGTHFTPIINAPEVAILGVSKSSTKPVWDGKAFVPRMILPLSLSYDHRVIDGASGARFNAYLVQLLGDFRRIAL